MIKLCDMRTIDKLLFFADIQIKSHIKCLQLSCQEKYINSYQKLINIKCENISCSYLMWIGVRGQGSEVSTQESVVGVQSWRVVG